MRRRGVGERRSGGQGITSKEEALPGARVASPQLGTQAGLGVEGGRTPGARGEAMLGRGGICRKASSGVKRQKGWDGVGAGLQLQAGFRTTPRPSPQVSTRKNGWSAEIQVACGLASGDPQRSPASLRATGSSWQPGAPSGISVSQTHAPSAGPTHRGPVRGARCFQRPPAPPRGTAAGRPPGVFSLSPPWLPGGPGGGISAT